MYKETFSRSEAEALDVARAIESASPLALHSNLMTKRIRFQLAGWLVAGLLMAVGCRSQQTVILSRSIAASQPSPISPPEYELTRFRRKDIAKEAIVAGHIDQLYDKRLFEIEWVGVWVDRKSAPQDATTHTNSGGYYVLELSPGPHEILAGAIGMLPYMVKLQLVRGDSIRLNFHLRTDMRPTTN